MCDKDETNYVAKAHNWDQRVKGELESARVWDTNWGVLYAKDIPTDYQGKIQKLQDEINKLPTVKGMTSLTQMSYRNVKPYDEWHDFKRKSIERLKQNEYNELVKDY